ncbi:MAG: glutathione S-transferase family protein [Parvibaculaceae bacterium]|nr:glutathione S-transferase family protein [Parvibaculaceae bacterium]HBM88556.1 glutathione S-transferase [Rhodobiaceae bacterium]
MKLYHCKGARSVRPLWTLEEMGLDYELESMKFPPRFLRDGYTDLNPIGTVPYFVDGDVEMTESAGISQYLVDVHGPSDIGLKPGDKDYGPYLNWLHRSDATLTFPQTIVLRYTQLEPEERRIKQAADDYAQWFFSRLKSVELATADREYLCAGRFTIADICVGYALYLADTLGFREGFKPNTEKYYARLTERPAFQRAIEL